MIAEHTFSVVRISLALKLAVNYVLVKIIVIEYCTECCKSCIKSATYHLAQTQEKLCLLPSAHLALV